MWISKRVSAEQMRLEALLARQTGAVRRAFLAYLADMKSDYTIRQVRELIERGQIEQALRIADQHVIRLGNVIPTVFAETARAEVAGIGAQFGSSLGRVAVSFDPTHQSAANIMLQSRLRFIREFTDKQRDVTRTALSQAFMTGQGPREASRAFRDSIGLTRNQFGAVSNYRRLLEQGSAEALARDLRDRRFDPSTARAFENGEPLDASQIERMVGRYQERMLAYRAENIARTESMEAVGTARDEAMRQVVEQADIDDHLIERTWHSTRDERTRDTHRDLNGQTVRGLSTPFVTNTGVHIRFPGDPDAPAEERINCRCPQPTIRILRPEEAYDEAA